MSQELPQVPKYGFLLVLLRAICYAAVTGLIILAFASDAVNQAVKEDSMTEYAQAIFLFLSASLSLYMFKKYRPVNAMAFVLGIFYLVLFVREHDAFLETNFFNKAWQAIVVVLLIPLVIYLVRNFKLFTIQLYALRNSVALGVLTVGFVIVQLYSRLYGKGKLWESLMGEEFYMRSVKDASEESIELLGYAILFIGTVELLLHARRLMKNSGSYVS